MYIMVKNMLSMVVNYLRFILTLLGFIDLCIDAVLKQQVNGENTG